MLIKTLYDPEAVKTFPSGTELMIKTGAVLEDGDLVPYAIKKINDEWRCYGDKMSEEELIELMEFVFESGRGVEIHVNKNLI